MSKDAISGFGSHSDVNGTGAQTGVLGQCVVSLAEVSATRSAFGGMSLSPEETLFNTAEEDRKIAGFKDWRDAWYQIVEVRQQRREKLLKARHADSGEKRVKPLYEKGQNCSRYGCLICKGPHWTKDCPIEIDLSDDEEDGISPQDKEEGCLAPSGDEEPRPDGDLNDVLHVVGFVNLPPTGSVVDSPMVKEPEDLCRDEGITSLSGRECHGQTFEHYARRCRNEGIAKLGVRECHDPIVTKRVRPNLISLAWQGWADGRLSRKASHACTGMAWLEGTRDGCSGKQVSHVFSWRAWLYYSKQRPRVILRWSHTTMEGSGWLHTIPTSPDGSRRF